jgi:ABC-type multidrug transport system ATPase subunit
VLDPEGKSTLLDILSMRKNSGRARGEIKVVGREETGYVEQFDTLVGELTVENMLRYTSELLCCDLTKEQRISRVNDIISRLDLEKVRYSVIGTALKRGISGGEVKRLNIGIALIPSPKVQTIKTIFTLKIILHACYASNECHFIFRFYSLMSRQQV